MRYAKRGKSPREARCPGCGWLFSLREGEHKGALCCHCKRDAEYEARYGPDWRAALAREIDKAQEKTSL